MTSTETTTPALYWQLWKGVPRELLFQLLGFPIALAAFVVTQTLFWTGVGSIFTFILGVVCIIGAMYVARGFGWLELRRLGLAGMPHIAEPVWQQREPGFWSWLRSMFGNGHYWLYLLYTVLTNFIVTVITWSLTVTWVAFILGGATLWLWADRAGVSDDVPRIVFSTLAGLVALVSLPFVTRGLTLVHHYESKLLLGAFASDALRLQVGDLTQSRGAALSAEGHSLRRLERDIHDGPQQRLVRLQMDLAAAERQLATDPEKARGLIAEAMDQSKEALEELRALSRGFAPPMLLDRGLVAALESAAARGTVPTRIVNELGDDVSLPLEIERNAYFVASEALANAAKHAGATDIEVRVQQRLDAETTWLVVSVADDGVGGALATPGHGLAGLEERMRGLGGSLMVQSPPGGPTIVSAQLPLALSMSGSVQP